MWEERQTKHSDFCAVKLGEVEKFKVYVKPTPTGYKYKLAVLALLGEKIQSKYMYYPWQ